MADQQVPLPALTLLGNLKQRWDEISKSTYYKLIATVEILLFLLILLMLAGVAGGLYASIVLMPLITSTLTFTLLPHGMISLLALSRTSRLNCLRLEPRRSLYCYTSVALHYPI